MRSGVGGHLTGDWFRDSGGMPSIGLATMSDCQLNFAEREEISILRAGGAGVHEIARQSEDSFKTQVARTPLCAVYEPPSW